MKSNTAVLLVSLFLSIEMTGQQVPLTYTQDLLNFPNMTCCPASIDPSDYEVVFVEEFLPGGLDNDIWQTDFPFTADRCYTTFYDIWMGEEGENVLIEPDPDDGPGSQDGILRIKVDQRQPSTDCAAPYSGGQIWSKEAYNFRYGKFSCRFRVPQGEYFWPAFWMQAHDSDEGKDEIDMFEAFGYRNGETWHTIYDVNSVNTIGNYETWAHAQFAMEFAEMTFDTWHDIEMEWTPYSIKVFLNEVLVYETHRYYAVENGVQTPILCKSRPSNFGYTVQYIENMAFPDAPMRLCAWMILQDPGLVHGNTVEENTPLPGYFDIDYIRVEQVPASFWGECEHKLFCTYGITEDHRADFITACADFDEETELTLFSNTPSSSFNDWMNNLSMATGDANLELSYQPNSTNDNSLFSDVGLVASQGFNFGGLSSFYVEVSENLSGSCIGQNRRINYQLKVLDSGLDIVLQDVGPDLDNPDPNGTVTPLKDFARDPADGTYLIPPRNYRIKISSTHEDVSVSGLTFQFGGNGDWYNTSTKTLEWYEFQEPYHNFDELGVEIVYLYNDKCSTGINDNTSGRLKFKALSCDSFYGVQLDNLFYSGDDDELTVLEGLHQLTYQYDGSGNTSSFLTTLIANDQWSNDPLTQLVYTEEQVGLPLTNSLGEGYLINAEYKEQGECYSNITLIAGTTCEDAIGINPVQIEMDGELLSEISTLGAGFEVDKTICSRKAYSFSLPASNAWAIQSIGSQGSVPNLVYSDYTFGFNGSGLYESFALELSLIHVNSGCTVLVDLLINTVFCHPTDSDDDNDCDFVIAPNPFADQVTISDFIPGGSKDYQNIREVKLVEVNSGRVITSVRSNNRKVTIDKLGGVPLQGLHYLEVVGDGGAVCRKMVVSDSGK